MWDFGGCQIPKSKMAILKTPAQLLPDYEPFGEYLELDLLKASVVPLQGEGKLQKQVPTESVGGNK